MGPRTSAAQRPREDASPSAGRSNRGHSAHNRSRGEGREPLPWLPENRQFPPSRELAPGVSPRCSFPRPWGIGVFACSKSRRARANCEAPRKIVQRQSGGSPGDLPSSQSFRGKRCTSQRGLRGPDLAPCSKRCQQACSTLCLCLPSWDAHGAVASLIRRTRRELWQTGWLSRDEIGGTQ